jgi:hypothetical protein
VSHIQGDRYGSYGQGDIGSHCVAHLVHSLSGRLVLSAQFMKP